MPLKITIMSSSNSPKAKASAAKNESKKTHTAFEHMVKAAAGKAKANAGRIAILTLLAICYAMGGFDMSHNYQYGFLLLLPDGAQKSGRSGSLVYMRNGRVRSFKVPALVQNIFTGPVRAAFASFSAGFRALTQAQISAWNAASGFFKSDRFGRPVEVKGKALYQMLNQNLQSIGEAPIDTPPAAGAVNGVVSITNVGADNSASTLSIGIDPSPTDANTTHLLFATAPLSAGVSRPSASAYRVINVIGGGSTTPLAAGTEYIAKFGSMPVGQKIFVKLLPINLTTGQAGPPAIGSTVIVA